MNLTEAETLVVGLVERMRPYCQLIEPAGSVRRKKPDVRDLEIVCCPIWEKRTVRVGLFGEEQCYHVNLLHSWATNESGLNFIKTGTSEIIPWSIEPDGKYWRAWMNEHEIKLDIWLCEPESWGYILMLRTGSSAFNEEIARRGLVSGRRYTTEYLRGCTSEEECFDRLGLVYVPPEERTDGRAVTVESRQEEIFR